MLQHFSAACVPAGVRAEEAAEDNGYGETSVKGYVAG